MNYRLSAAPVVLSISIVISLLPLSYGEMIDDLPDAVVCSVKDPTGFLPWEELVFYVSAHTQEGDTLFKTLTSDFSFYGKLQ